MSDRDRADYRQELYDRYGGPTDRIPNANTGNWLRALRLRRQIHPLDVMVFRYATREAAEAYADANRKFHSIDVIGPVETERGIVSVLDMRKQFADLGYEPTDPRLPDDAPRKRAHV